MGVISRDAVSLGVQCEVVGTGESSSTISTNERPVSRVFTTVSGQLVGARKLPATVWPLTGVRLLTYIHTQHHRTSHILVTGIEGHSAAL